MHTGKSNMPRQSGFTLIEVMIVIVILGILVTVGLPSYQDSLRKSRRADGMSALMELSARQERFYAQNSIYTADVNTTAGLNYGATTSPDGHYNLTAANCGAGANQTLAFCYIVTAAPASASQLKDSRCASFSLDSFGNKTASGTHGADCW
jgi:type IV pilus assembly protein PilE